MMSVKLSKQFAGWCILATMLLFSVPLSAATFYVSTSGTKTSGASVEGDWSNSNCYSTISAAIRNMSGSDEVVVNDGIYTGYDNVIGRHTDVTVPDGTEEAYTKIYARNPFGVTLDSSQSSEWDYYGAMIYLDGVDYVEIDGFKGINRDGSNNHFITITNCTYITMKRCLIRTSTIDNRENSVLCIYGDRTDHILIEDVGITGGYRYGFTVMGYSGSAPHNIVFRRCIGRPDWCDSDEPHAMFAIYGDNDNASEGPYNVAFQNCIAIDQNAGVPDSDWKPYGPLYIFKGVHDVIVDSCIFLNNDQTGSTSGSWFTEDYSGSNLYATNSIFYAYTGVGITFGGNFSQIQGCTFGGSSGYGARTSSLDSAMPLRNCLFLSSTTDNLYSYSTPPTGTYNSFQAGTPFGSSNITYQSDCLYLPRVEVASNRYGTGYDSGNVGAHIIKRLGTSGTYYGDSGWNTSTDIDLWPWPYEDEIKEWFAVENDPPVGADLSSNDTDRGFCANGQTLTKYIWEYLGNTIPPEIYASQGDTTPPSDVTDVASVVNNGALTLSWINPSDADFVGTMVRYGLTTYPDDHKEGSLFCDRPATAGSIDSFTGNLPEGTYYMSIFTYDRSGNFSHTVYLIVEVVHNENTIAPTGSITINAGADETETTAVELTLNAQDNESVIVQMRFSNDGTIWTSSEAYSTSKSWNLEDGLGLKTVYVKFQDEDGNWSVNISDTIDLVDRTPPSIPTGVVAQ